METFPFNGKTYKVFNLDFCGQTFKIFFVADSYRHGGTLAVSVYDIQDGEAEPFCTATVNLGDDYLQDDRHAFADTNNSNWLLKFVKEHKLAKTTGISMPSGYCVYPLLKWNTKNFLADAKTEGK